MIPTVADVLAMPAVKRGRPRVVAGRGALGRRVLWVHAAEVADIAHLLRGGEFVLTTGIALPDDAVGLRGYVQALDEAGAAGVLVELGRRWKETVPAALVESCDEFGLPLVTVAREVRFAAITQAVGEQVVAAHLAELQAAELVHNSFTELSLSGAEPAEIIAEAGRISGHAVVLESFRHQVLGYNAGAVPVAALLADWESRSRTVRTPHRTAYDETLGWLITVVGSRGNDWGRLVLVTEAPPPHRHMVLIERAAAALALHRMHARERDSLERRSHHGLLLALRDRPFDSDVVARCDSSGFPLRRRQLLASALVPKLDDTAQASSVAGRLDDLASTVATTLRTQQVAALVAIDGDEVHTLLSLTRDKDPDEVLAGIADDARKLGPVAIGVGEIVRDPALIGRTLAEARHVAASAARSSSSRVYHRLADVHVRGLLHLLGDDERLQMYAQRELGDLFAHDRKHGTELVEVVRFLVSHRNRAQAAAALHVSRPVLYDRLARAERILEVDLDDPEVRTSLHLALLVADDGVEAD